MKVQRIMIDAGFTCPNRDGRVGTGGCTFCRNDSFSPRYCDRTRSITEQIADGKKFFKGKYPDMKYVAYFQSYTNTYGDNALLKHRYEEALAVEDVVGLVIGTRPDCVSSDILDYLEELNNRTSLMIEYGVESCYDRTLKRINRGHDFASAVKAITETARRGIKVGVHLIFGLPGETRDDILEEAKILNELPINVLKIHQLQILKDTKIAEEWVRDPGTFLDFSADDYARLVAEFIKCLKPEIELERFASSAPQDIVIHPKWGLKPQEVERKIARCLANEK